MTEAEEAKYRELEAMREEVAKRDGVWTTRPYTGKSLTGFEYEVVRFGPTGTAAEGVPVIGPIDFEKAQAIAAVLNIPDYAAIRDITDEEGNGLSAKIGGEYAANFAAMVAAAFRDTQGATNYVEWKVRSTLPEDEGTEYTVLIQKKTGWTPADIIAEIKKAFAAFHRSKDGKDYAYLWELCDKPSDAYQEGQAE